MKKYQIIFLALFAPLTAQSLEDIDYRGEFFSWVWQPCLYQIAENKGAGVATIDDAFITLHSELEGEHFDKNAWETEKAVEGLPPEERSEAYEYLRNECAGGYVASDYLPTWGVGEAPF